MEDGIPSIDQPQFTDARNWDALNCRENGLVIGFELEGIRHAYPFQILDWHEIVNDTVASKPMLITCWPLCGTGIVFERVIDGFQLPDEEMAASLMLDLRDQALLIDPVTDGRWPALNGMAIGSSSHLTLIESSVSFWFAWSAFYPDTTLINPS